MIKKNLFLVTLCLSFLWSSALLHGEITHQRKFTVAISLGEVCQPAGNLHANQMRYQSFPLDWLITPFEGLFQFIANEGKDFAKKENLLFNITAFGIPNGVLDTRYGIYFYHDFEFSSKICDNNIKKFQEVEVKKYDEDKTKLERRIKRFFDILHSDKKVLLVRLGITRREALRLDGLLHTQYPHLDYVIVAVDDREEAKYDWGLQRVKNFYMERKTMWDSRLEDWKAILAQFPFEHIPASS